MSRWIGSPAALPARSHRATSSAPIVRPKPSRTNSREPHEAAERVHTVGPACGGRLAERGPAEFCDVYVDPDVITVAECARVSRGLLISGFAPNYIKGPSSWGRAGSEVGMTRVLTFGQTHFRT